jgi:LysM repeat protein/uncharacterized protein YvpB
MFSKRWLVFLSLAAAFLPEPARADQLPDTASVSGVSGHPQALPLDCESRSAADWAAYWGVSVDELAFFNALPRSDNPETGFVGYVYDVPGNLPPRGYGVYPPPVATLLKEVYGLPATARAGLSEDGLRSELASGRPVIVWYIYGFRVTGTATLTASDGGVYLAAPFEHTGIAIAYDSNSYTVIDAYSGWALRVDRGAFLNSWGVLGNLAVTGSGLNLDPLLRTAGGSSAAGPAVYYTVLRGDTIGSIAAKFGVAWTDLAAANNLSAPYTIYPGQQLFIPGSGTPAPAQPVTVPTPDPSVAVPSTYTVQSGDSLAGIARKFGLAWADVAAANGIGWPYTIYPGQVLNLPAR